MIKKLIFRFFILSLWLLCAAPVMAQMLGDVNDDSTVNVIDALRTAQHCVGVSPFSFEPSQADVDGNGVINIVDVLLIAQHSVGLITVFPASTAVYPLDKQYKVIKVPIINLELFEI